MIQMPEASAIVHAWLIDISNSNYVDGEDIFRKLQTRIRDGKLVWEQAVEELSSLRRERESMLARNIKYQTICSLETIAKELADVWANKYTVHVAAEKGP